MTNDFSGASNNSRETWRKDGWNGVKTKGWGSDKNKLGASKEGVIKGRKDGNDVSSKVFWRSWEIRREKGDSKEGNSPILTGPDGACVFSLWGGCKTAMQRMGDSKGHPVFLFLLASSFSKWFSLTSPWQTSVMERNIAAWHLNTELLPETCKQRPESLFWWRVFVTFYSTDDTSDRSSYHYKSLLYHRHTEMFWFKEILADVLREYTDHSF